MKNCNSGSKKNDLGTQGLSKLTEAMLLRSIIQVYALAIKMASQELFSWSSIYNVSIFIINSCPLYNQKPVQTTVIYFWTILPPGSLALSHSVDVII